MYLDTPKILGVVRIKDIPPASVGTTGPGKQRWAKIFDELMQVPKGHALFITAPTQAAWVSGRFHSLAKRRGFKIATAVRKDKMYVWII